MFDRQKISSNAFEAASAFDVDNNGVVDIISGEYWYEGPDFDKAHKICELPEIHEYHDDFSNYPMDVNGNGYMDIMTGGWFGKTVRWRENPQGRHEPWTTHDVDECGNIEITRFWDVNGDGHVEAIPNAGGNIVVYQLIRDAAGKGTGQFKKHVLKQGGIGHGLGFGDINGDGRGDFVAAGGWLEAPEKPFEQEWIWHQEFELGSASVPIIVHDVNEDGLADLIVGSAHGYGLVWYEQKLAGSKREWIKHVIDMDHSQYHDMFMADLDRDGKLELITGKRYRAHNGNDPGSTDPLFLCYFKINGGKFDRYTLEYGPAGQSSGAGIYFWVADVDGNGWLDIVAPGKEGLYLFRNRGFVPKLD
ncbi:MAG: VCBS repeat-containing protein [Phycisphaerales bacterium]|nr:VCBS repeat-containing protein [Phycisphaerales bacterium]